MLVGGSSTGKTRACWEALQLLRDRPGQWRLWHPIDPSRPEAALRELPGIGPRTVVWLNEAQFYLDAADGGLGERVAAGLRELLRDPARAPVLVLATLWPLLGRADRPPGRRRRPACQGAGTAGRSRHPRARRVHRSAAAELGQAGDARLALAAAAAQDGQVIQFLAGAPELLARYRNAPPGGGANQRGDGCPPPGHGDRPAARLPGSRRARLPDRRRVGRPGRGLAGAGPGLRGRPCKGVRGPLIPIRPRPASSRAAGSGSRDDGEQLAGGRASPAGRVPARGLPGSARPQHRKSLSPRRGSGPRRQDTPSPATRPRW